MPALGMAQETGTLIRWLKREGDSVAKGEPLIEIETDKVTVEIEALVSGILINITAEEGDVVPVGQTIGHIISPEELAASGLSPDTVEPPAARLSPPEKARIASPVAARMAAEHGIELSQVRAEQSRIMKADVQRLLERSPEPAPARVPASPKARRLAKEAGLDVGAIAGSGPNGAVLAADVVARADARHSSKTVRSGNQPGELLLIAPQPIDLPRSWGVMAQRTADSWREVPHFVLYRDVDGTRLHAWLQSVQGGAPVKITYTDLLVKLVAAALNKHPRLNARWKAGAVLLNASVDICLAVAVPDGLITPVIRAADTLSIRQLAQRRLELIEKARENQLQLTDVSGGTFTISNLGMYKVDAFSAIINAPQAAILAVGRLVDRVVPIDGKPEVRPQMTLSISCDHRVIDGAGAAAFLDDLANLIEEPLNLLG